LKKAADLAAFFIDTNSGHPNSVNGLPWLIGMDRAMAVASGRLPAIRHEWSRTL
jgi:hypothetical protein